ncbi:heterokaryon incompatibility protein-domain-containing protein [Tricladium varicosporioides]|nr:heterokaryon incompatibility protein-domain-containing protein [Hymenoscyphus varicosporioides]
MTESENSARRERVLRSELQYFNDPDLANMEEFVYDKLPAAKRVRLLQLRSGTTHGPEIFCELIEADYDNSFHILTRRRGEQERKLTPGEEEEEEKRKQKEEDARLEEEWNLVKANEIKYEALSWCWGIDPPLYTVKIEKGGRTYKKSVRKELALALKYLRLPNQTRTLWIDAICINQEDPEERNRQVQMMSRIYTRSKEVCIWLGPDDDQSKLAIDFIHGEIMELKNFDMICSDKRYTGKWQALMVLMQRDWFSRRWVVQEIALASKAKVYCGPDSIPWKEFAVAVELFVEVETATHRLSEVMQKDEKYQHVPAYFEYVSELGASLLVQATGKVFRAQRTPLDDGPGEIQTFKELLKITRSVNTIDPLDRRSLLSLEYLVSTMFIFKATEPRDAIYSLLAVARDAAPLAKPTLENQDKSFLIMSLFDQFLDEKPFMVDYSRPYSDVCRDFVEFVIRCKAKLDPVQALDILCRPWALESQGGASIRLAQKSTAHSNREKKEGQWLIKRDRLKPWKKRRGTVRKDGTKFIYDWEDTKDAKTKILVPQEDDFDKGDFGGDIEKYWGDLDPKKNWKEINRNKVYEDGWKLPGGFDKVMEHLEVKPPKGENDDANGAWKRQQKYETKDITLPNWIARALNAPFSLYQHPGMHILKTGRANADPLVGQPQDGHRNYSAAKTKEIELKFLKFRKRPKLGHYSIYVTGFVLDTVDEVRDASQGGNIPKSWLDLGEWVDYKQDPPDRLWRTLVADRGRDNRNPPYYYARACKESVHKGGITSGRVNTTALINNERNSIVAEFCRRVHAVIWNRSLFRTESGKLGLASKVQKGDKVCILYGCTVPVILRQYDKKPGAIEAESFEDQIEALKSCYVKMVDRRERKARALGKMKDYDQEEWEELRAAKDKANRVLYVERCAKEAAGAAGEVERTKLEAEGLMQEETQEADYAEQEAEKVGGKAAIAKQKTEDKQKAEESRQRKVKVFYEFNGEAYIHGMMDGEALPEKFYKRIPDRVFELR